VKIIRRKPDKGYIDTHLWVPKSFVDVEGTKSALTHTITDSYTNNQRYLYLYKETADHLLLPRSFWDVGTLPFPVVDCRPRSYEFVDFESRVELDHKLDVVDDKCMLLPTGKDVQRKSIDALINNPGGVLQLGCGTGKTVIALHKIALGRVPALVMLDNTNLLYQWAQEAEKFLTIPGGIGFIEAGKKQWKHGLVLATYHSIANWSDTMPEEIRRWFGQIFWDEGHHVSAPVFAKSADLFYGNRYALTATPERDDGMHVICDLHVGPVLHKDLTPPMKATVAFKHTGLRLDVRDPRVHSQVVDSNGEIHLSRVYSFFGQWLTRLMMIIDTCHQSIRAGRKIMVLSNSVDEVVNLMALWVHGDKSALYTDIPIPSPAEVGESLTPYMMSSREHKKYEKKKSKLERQLAKANLIQSDRTTLQAELQLIEQLFQQVEVHSKIQNELKRRQKAYVQKLLEADCSAGFLTYGVPPKVRQAYTKNKSVVFAVTKYGKEGLDCPDLDTVIVSSLFSSRNGLQQLIGRPTRPQPGKKQPLILMLVDEVGQCIGMSKKLMTHLRAWPIEEGGPYEPILVDYSTWQNRKGTSTLTDLLTQ